VYVSWIEYWRNSMKKLFAALVLFTAAACTPLATPGPIQMPATEASPAATAGSATLPSDLDMQPPSLTAEQESQALIVWQPDPGEVQLRRVDPRNGQDAPNTPPLDLGDSDSGSILSTLSDDGKLLALASAQASDPYAGGVAAGCSGYPHTRICNWQADATVARRLGQRVAFTGWQ
jgi:hypothetical protein